MAYLMNEQEKRGKRPANGDHLYRKLKKPSLSLGVRVDTCHWNKLSDEVILAVFKSLDKVNLFVCSRVCKRWQRLAYDESLWQSLNLSEFTVDENVLKQLFNRGVVVMRLAWLKVLPLTDVIEDLSNDSAVYRVQYLDVTSSSISEKILHQVLKSCKNLKKLSLEACSISDRILRAISRCHHLSVLNLSMCQYVGKVGLRSLAIGCSRVMTELNLAWTNLTPESIDVVVKSFPLLRKLNLSGCRETLCDEAVSVLLSTCPNLSCLDLSDCTEISERSVRCIVDHGNIKHLALSRCRGIAPESLQTLSLLRSLHSAQLFGFTTENGSSDWEKALKGIEINMNMFTNIARPVGSTFKGTIWDIKCSALH
ncbi:S-phase kinase-associated protein 2-like [Xenia sp. Carnegie-2017]|uniref:S-phase kinase-associated protein 2-like n=1 Tax=Xenia sp. Carnegie-2017 TaxID=2897299 RepID=UPI001F042581|nr:S-phase kinase-associated protein 2-like [Xenia sp. Carnegie-2017]XP_046865083.1 S-phase kinase-associated protein 2-like [Xenia sp. Carnegie-2017]